MAAKTRHKKKMTENQNSTEKAHTADKSSFTKLLTTFKKKIGWDSWHEWHPMSKTVVKLFPLLLIALAIPLTVNFLQQQQTLNQFASPRCNPNIPGLAKYCITPAPTSPTPTKLPSTPTPTSTAVGAYTPTPTPSSRKVINVSSIAALKAALADNTIDEIVVANGTYAVSTAGSQASNSLWIGSQFASRTRPILVRAETTGGVTFDGGGATYFGGISFEQGVHDQIWQGFKFANGEPTATGVIVFGGYTGYAAPHHITLRNIAVLGSVTSDNPVGVSHDHAVYFSNSVGGVHDILIDGFTVDGSGGLDSALHFYHSSATERNAWNVTVRNMTVNKTDQAIIVWDATVQNIVIEDSTVTNAIQFAVRYEQGGTLTLRRVTSTGSGQRGFYSSLGTNPPGVTFDNSSLN